MSPDHGGVTRARKMADRMKAPIAIIDKRRPRPNVAEVMSIVGKLTGKLRFLSMILLIPLEQSQWQLTHLLKVGQKRCTHVVRTLYYQVLQSNALTTHK